MHCFVPFDHTVNKQYPGPSQASYWLVNQFMEQSKAAGFAGGAAHDGTCTAQLAVQKCHAHTVLDSLGSPPRRAGLNTRTYLERGGFLTPTHLLSRTVGDTHTFHPPTPFTLCLARSYMVHEMHHNLDPRQGLKVAEEQEEEEEE